MAEMVVRGDCSPWSYRCSIAGGPWGREPPVLLVGLAVLLMGLAVLPMGLAVLLVDSAPLREDLQVGRAG